jgi:hypothetical protein
MRLSLAGLVFMMIAVALASGCQSPPPPVAAPAAEIVNPTVACERGCSTGYDSCMDAAQAPVAGVKSGGHSDPIAAAPDPGDVCRDQLKACLRQCLN